MMSRLTCQGCRLAVAFPIEALQIGEPMNGEAVRIMLTFKKDLPQMLRQPLAGSL